MSSPAIPTSFLLRLDTLRLALLTATIFMLAGANGIPRWWNSAYPALLFSAALFAIYASERGLAHVHVRMPCTALFFVLWVTAACASWIAHPTVEGALTFLYAYLIPCAIYLAMGLRNLTREEHTLALIALSVGALIPALAGLIAYYQIWGVPTLAEAALHRYNLVRMEPYHAATFGNVGHMAGYACLIAPAVLAAALTTTQPPYARFLFLACYFALALNMLAVFSRAGFLVFLAFTAIVLLIFRRYKLLLVGSVVLVAWVYRNVTELDWSLDHLNSAINLDADSDNSIAERYDSIVHSWARFTANPLFGVGLGLSRTDNPFAVAHQFFVHQAAELGVLGLFACVALTITVTARFFRAAFQYRPASPSRWTDVVWLGGATGWLFYVCIAGATLNISIVIPWAGLFAAFLALSGSGAEAKTGAV